MAENEKFSPTPIIYREWFTFISKQVVVSTFYFHPDPWGFDEPNLTNAHIFQMGWWFKTTNISKAGRPTRIYKLPGEVLIRSI